jgi:hypothetical protein
VPAHHEKYDAQLNRWSPSGEGWQVSGTPQNAAVAYPMTVPADSDRGTWTAQYLELDDRVGNHLTINTADGIAALGFPTTFTNGP